MTGRAEVDRQRRKLDATFQRAAAAQGDAELLSDLARYLCVLVAGFLEQAVIEVLLEHVRIHSHSSIQRHLEQRLRQFTNPKAQKLLDLFGSFDPDWRLELENLLVDEYKDAVNGIVDLRNTISHGRFAGVTIVRVQEYYGRVKHVVSRVADLCVPE
jgi:hypothetical protein